MENNEFIKKLKEIINKGSIDEAYKLYKEKDPKDIIDSEFHYQLGLLLEEINYVNEAIKEYNLSIRDDNLKFNAHCRLAEIFLDKGDIDLAIQQYRCAIEKGCSEKEIFLKLGKIYEQRDEKGSAIELYNLAFERTSDKLFQSLIKNLKSEREIPAEEEKTKASLEINNILQFLNLFSGRENVYARQWVKKDGQCGYSPIHEPLTPRIVREHLLGNITIGVYPIRLDNTVNFLAFDLDIDKKMMEKAHNDPAMMELFIGMVHETACKIINLCKKNNIPIYLEDSGYKGRHCWIFLETALDAQIAKSFAEIVVKNIDIPKGIHIEIFPKQSLDTEKMLGNLIKLPLGIHRKSGRRALFINEDGTPIFDQLKFLDNVIKANKAQIFQAGEILKTTIREHSEIIPEPIPIPKIDEIEVPPSMEFPYKLEEDPIIKYLFSHCEVLSAINDKALKEHELNHDEQIVLIYSIGCLEEGYKKVNAIFDKCLNIEEAMYQKKQQRGNPISCPKIRQRIPNITKSVKCNCYFSPELGAYPHPLLHLKMMPKAAEQETTETWHLNYIVSEYLKAQKEIKQLNNLIDRLEQSLNKFFEDAGTDILNTPFGKLKREISNGKSKFILEI